MQEPREIVVPRDADITVLDDACSAQTQTQPLVPGVHLPEQDGLDLSHTWRIAIGALFTMEPTGLTELCGCGVEMPCYRGPGTVDGILGLFR